MLHFNVLKCLNMVSEHYWTLSVSHIIAILQLDKAGMLNKIIWVNCLKIESNFGIWVSSSEVPKDLEVYKETM